MKCTTCHVTAGIDGLRALAEFQMKPAERQRPSRGRTGEPTEEDGLGFAMRRLQVLGGGGWCMPGRQAHHKERVGLWRGGRGTEQGLSGSGRRWDFALCPDLMLCARTNVPGFTWDFETGLFVTPRTRIGNPRGSPLQIGRRSVWHLAQRTPPQGK